MERHAKRARNGPGEFRSMPERPRAGMGENGEAEEIEKKSNSLQDIGIVELLEYDSRPTFIIDLQSPDTEVKGRMHVVFCNKSLRFFDDLRNVVYAETFYPAQSPSSNASTESSSDQGRPADELSFKTWATGRIDDSNDGYLPRHTFRNMFWTCATLRNRWRVVSASQVPNQRRESHGTPKSSRATSRSATSTADHSEDKSEDACRLPEEAKLSKKLADSELRFRVLTELSPVGMYYLTPDGNMEYANDMWYEITGHPRGLEGEMSFMNVLSECEHELMGREWKILTTEKGKRVFELRLRNPWYDEWGNPKQKWILASCDQEFDEEGRLKSIMGCITDISLQKQAEEDAVERAKLVEKLALRTEEAAQHERNFQQMAELAPCGMFTFSPEGSITWANSQWYEMTGHSRNPEEHCPMSFLNFIEPQDHEGFHRLWLRLTVTKEEVSSELRLKKPWIRQVQNEEIRDTTWILFLALPQLDDNGNLIKVLGCTTDVSHFKWAESVQTQSRVQAEEAKRQQEAFIDMTSHEMRNPLSAMLLCADGIAEALLDFQAAKDKTAIMSDALVENNLDAAQTIVLCAQHQKRIIDDVLTLSKLNATMLHVTPVQVQVETTLRRTLKMFDNEFVAHDIRVSFDVEESYRQAKVDLVLCDPVRLVQIFINLLTNAIKFTRSECKKQIAVTIGASVSGPPKDVHPDIEWFPSKDSGSIQDLTLAPEWGTGDQLYLYFAVRDTGRGLSTDERIRLFNRFSQASPRTHVQYGGSGLGLFISRELTELQGGEIGVASKAGEGSTFAFYIKGRRSSDAHRDHLARPSIMTSRALSATEISSAALGSPLPTPMPDTPFGAPRMMHNYHILLVEDNLINQKVLSKQLRNTGCTVYVANHGVEALDFLSTTTLWKDGSLDQNRNELSVILMDLEMPIMDGLTCTRKIRDLEREGKLKHHVPIIAVTANARSEQMDIALEAGMDDIMPKPFHIPELIQKTHQLMVGRMLGQREGQTDYFM